MEKNKKGWIPENGGMTTGWVPQVGKKAKGKLVGEWIPEDDGMTTGWVPQVGKVVGEWTGKDNMSGVIIMNKEGGLGIITTNGKQAGEWIPYAGMVIGSYTDKAW